MQDQQAERAGGGLNSPPATSTDDSQIGADEASLQSLATRIVGEAPAGESDEAAN